MDDWEWNFDSLSHQSVAAEGDREEHNYMYLFEELTASVLQPIMEG